MALRSYVLQDVRIEIDAASITPPLDAALREGRYEHQEARALTLLLQPGDTYFELGGGVGFISTLASRIVRDAARIHVYEANPALIPAIERTWAANGAAGAVYNCMLGTGKGEHDFFVSKAFWASSGQIDYGNARRIRVPQRDFLRQLEKKEATFLMMDIEGGEGELLEKTLPARVRAVVAEYHPRIIGEDKVRALWTRLEEQGFRLVPEASTPMVRAHVRE
jgi:FkbM family methyltransferase